ncbi:MAG: RNA pseudouridine synthase [Bacilli bacterium]
MIKNVKKLKKIKIVFEDKNIIVVDKPANLLTISTNNEKERTMFHQVLSYEKKKNKNNKIFIVHRLDKDTSGLMLFAKNEKIKKILQDNWDQMAKLRGYIAVVEGKVEQQKGTIKSYLKENANYVSASTKQKSTGKLAITKFEKLKTSKNYSLLQIEILTGRKNQIRVHLKEMNHPIIGDKKYDAITNPLQRLGLHANILEIYHPITKELMKFVSKTPVKFTDMFSKKEKTK